MTTIQPLRMTPTEIEVIDPKRARHGGKYRRKGEVVTLPEHAALFWIRNGIGKRPGDPDPAAQGKQPARVYKCKTCGEEFPSPVALGKHKKTHVEG